MNAKMIHDADQVIASYRTTGVGIATMYLEMIKAGITADHARDICVEYLRGMTDSLRRPPTE